MKPIAIYTFVLAAALCVCTFPVFGQDMNSTNLPANAPVMTAADFAWDAALINLKEIRLGEAAQSNSQNTAVQKFGRHMVRDHTRLLERLEEIANSEGLPLPDTNTFYAEVTAPVEKPATELMAETTQQRLLDAQLAVQDLASMTGPAFDQAYANAMVEGHEKAIQKFEVASSTLQDESLKKYSDRGLKAIRHHLDMAKQQESQVMQGTNAPANGTPPM